MVEREALIGRFLARHGWAGAARRPLAADASFRRYERLVLGGRRRVLMDAPPPSEDLRPFLGLARHLVALGFSAPRIEAADADAGLALIEDLGDDTYTRRLAAGADEAALYALAVDVLIALHRRPEAEAVPPGLPRYGNGRLLDEAFLLVEWYAPAVLGHPLTEDARRAYGEAWLTLFPDVHAQPRTLVLRDYHVDNLMALPGRPGIAACGLLDFQDAVAGPAAYDLMSLVEDARRDIRPELKAALMDRYLAAFPGLDRAAFGRVFAVLAAQRHAKVIGIFTRLCRRDGKAQYLGHIPRVWRLLERAFEDPALAGVKDWFDRHLPPERREIPSWPTAAQ